MATTLEPRYSVGMRRFKPVLNLEYQQELVLTVERLDRSNPERQLAQLNAAVEAVAQRQRGLTAGGVPAAAHLPTVAYATALRLLRDLIAQGWEAGVDDEGIFLLPPEAALNAGDPAAAKSVLRRSFSFARQAQLTDPATAQFILGMERRGISTLFESGEELAERLQAAADAGDPSRAIQPVLQEVTPDAVDESTGIRLQNVWRYARHLWSIPYQSTPGRNMHYLVRDAGSPRRPIIGIAALGNAVLGLAQRDEALGWSVKALRTRLRDVNDAERLEVAGRLADTLRAAIADIYADDLLPPSGKLTGEDDSIAHLLGIEQAATDRRQRALEEAGDERIPEYYFIREAHTAAERGELDLVDWLAVARTDLYTRKRAATLASLLRALRTFDERRTTEDPAALLACLDDEVGRRAADVAIRQVKVRAIAENVMEIITCGAVAPYGEVLGGKLVAMLLTSPQVTANFRDRYAGRVSLIASAMKGAPVYRDPNLVLLTTSSLYSVGSSQYNRIRIPSATSVPGANAREDAVVYEYLGRTDSFGTVHIAPDTAEGLRAVATLSARRRQVNHLYGEGISPKLRTLRAGLDALGLQSDVFLRHHSPRLLYGVRLARNTDELLLGKPEAPDYILAGAADTDAMPHIANVWRERWLKPRVARAETVLRLRALGPAPLRVSRDIPTAGEGANPGGVPKASAEEATLPPLPTLDRAHTFVERLYRSANSYADRLTAEELEWINVDLGLDAYLLEQAAAGQQVIVTGNPGDGKTHLIERLRPQLEAAPCNAVVLTDANAMTDEEVLERWRECAATNRAFVLAINEWPLYVLRRKAQAVGFPAVGEALRQVQEAVRYVGDAPAPAAHRVVTVDLSLRNLLAAPVVRSALERLTHPRFYGAAGPTEDPASLNRSALQTARVQERLAAVLGHVARRGGHVTMRQLMGFLAYLITGGQSIVDRLASQGSGRFHYAHLAFEDGDGPLFDALRATFDPAVVTHPRHDLDLWRGTADPSGWLDPLSAAAVPTHFPEGERDTVYRALKRKFFFEHQAGGDLLDLIPGDEHRFEDLVARGANGDQQVVRDLLLGLNRFFEPNYSDDDRDELVLWQSHRYDVRAPETFVALHRLSSRHFRVEPPRYAPWVEAWLPDEQRRRRTFALVASDEINNTVNAQLVVDRDLFLTLTDAERGLGRASWSGSATRKITRFVDRLHHLVDQRGTVADVRVRDTSTGLERKYEVQRTPARYRV